MDEREGGLEDLVAAQARRFARERLDPAALDRTGGVSTALRAAAADAGLFGLSVPERHGGLGLSLGAVSRVIEELAQVDRSFATTIGLHAGLGCRGLVELGGEAIRDRWLPRLASGAAVASFAATEPSAGSDLSGVRTTASLEGDTLRLTGEKCYVTNGGFADVFTVLARTPFHGGRRATSLLLVPRSAPGVTVGPEEKKLGIRGSSTVSVFFDAVRLPRDHILGAPGAGGDHVGRVLTWGRTLMSAGCVGTARAALGATLAHVTTRRQSGRPIGQFGATRAHVTAMAWRLEAMRALVSHVATLEDEGRPRMAAAAAAAAKVLASEGAFEITDRALQLHGGMGYLEGTGIARMLRDCRVTRIFEGANDVLLVRLGTMLATGAAEMELCVEPDPGLPHLADERAWHDSRRELAEALAKERQHFGVRLVKEQVILAHVARAHIALLTAALVTRSPGGPGALIAVQAFRELVREARTELSRIDRDLSHRHAAISDALYAPFLPS